MIAEVPLRVAPSRRWWIALSLALHAIAIAIVISAQLRLEQLAYRRPMINISLPAPPPPPSDDRCVAWKQSGCIVECVRWRDPAAPVACPGDIDLPPAATATMILPPGVLAPDEGPSSVHAVLEVCVAPDGHVLSALPLRSTTDPCRDLALARRALHWHYAPMPESVCGEVKL